MPLGKGKRGADMANGGRKRARNHASEVDSRPLSQNQEPVAVHFPPPSSLGISQFDNLFSNLRQPATSQFSPPATSPSSAPSTMNQIVIPTGVIQHPDITHPSVFIP
jgi:hypothetical protein